MLIDSVHVLSDQCRRVSHSPLLGHGGRVRSERADPADNRVGQSEDKLNTLLHILLWVGLFLSSCWGNSLSALTSSLQLFLCCSVSLPIEHGSGSHSFFWIETLIINYNFVTIQGREDLAQAFKLWNDFICSCRSHNSKHCTSQNPQVW